MSQPIRVRAARWLTALEARVDRALVRLLRGRAGWRTTVLAYVGHGTSRHAHLRARVLLRRNPPDEGRSDGFGHGRSTGVRRRLRAVGRGLAPYLTLDVPGERVLVEVAGNEVEAVCSEEGYLDLTVELPGLEPGWHRLSWRLASEPDRTTPGRLLVVDPAARTGVVSDIDDTVLHTGLTQLLETLRTSLLTPEHDRRAIPGAAALYRALVDGDAGRAPVFYVSTGAWNLHAVMERFLERHRFPTGPLVMTDWGPGGDWLFRESSVEFKSRTVLGFMAEHPQLEWVLVGDSGQHDPEAYATVAHAHPDRIRAVYIREVPPHPPGRAARVREVAAELAQIGVPMRLVRDSAEAAEHAADQGLIDPAAVEEVRAALH